MPPSPRLSAVLRFPLHRLCPGPWSHLGRYSHVGGSGWGHTTMVTTSLALTHAVSQPPSHGGVPGTEATGGRGPGDLHS